MSIGFLVARTIQSVNIFIEAYYSTHFDLLQILSVSSIDPFLISFFIKLIVDYDEKLPLIESPEVNQKRMYICDYFYRIIDKMAQLHQDISAFYT